jgi:Domain of unknown function (DUF4276)
MKRLFIYVEGMTEEIFVERILRHHLARRGVKVERPLAAKKDFDPDGPRGGFTNWPAMEADMRDWFADHPDTPGSEARFTTLLDLYALPKEVPGYPGLRAATTEAHVAAIEAAIAAQLGEARFFPYLQRHEFEALLLAHPPALAHIFPTAAPALAALEAAIAGQNPEDINHGRNTHPAARINAAIPDYYELKASNAFWVAAEVTLDRMRARCPRFRAWLEQWEAWGMA